MERLEVSDDLISAEATALQAELEALEADIARLEEEGEVDPEIMGARRRFDLFCEYVLRDELSGERIKLDKIHRQWIAFIRESWKRGLRPLICAPYGSGKTTLFGVALPLFCVGNNVSLRVKIASATNTPAKERVSSCRQHIVDSPEFQAVFPHVKLQKLMKRQMYRLYVERPHIAKDPTIQAVSIVGPVLGSRVDLLILDDVNDMRNTIQNPSMRETVWRNYKNTLLSRLYDGGLVVGICTRWSQHDIVGKVLADEEMRQMYSVLTQAVSDDFEHIDTEIFFGRGSTAPPPIPLDVNELLAMNDAGLFDEALAVLPNNQMVRGQVHA